MLFLSGWRLFANLFLRLKQTGKRSLIVGANVSGEELVKKLRSRVEKNYDVVGFIDQNSQRIGEKISGVEILGNIDSIGRLIQDKNITEVIFSTDALSYTDILSVISRSRDRSVNYRLVPSTIEVIIGKSNIDELDAIPLVNIAYNIHQPFNRFAKRMFDIFFSFQIGRAHV